MNGAGPIKPRTPPAEDPASPRREAGGVAQENAEREVTARQPETRIEEEMRPFLITDEPPLQLGSQAVSTAVCVAAGFVKQPLYADMLRFLFRVKNVLPSKKLCMKSVPCKMQNSGRI